MFGSCVCSGGEKLPCNCLVRSHAEDMIPWTLITRTLNFYPVFLRQLIGFNASIVNFQNWTKCCAAAMLLSEKNESVHICHLEKSVCLLLAKFPPEAGVAQSESRQSLRTGKILSVDRWTSQVDRWTSLGGPTRWTGGCCTRCWSWAALIQLKTEMNGITLFLDFLLFW